jgi:Ring finger domain
MDSVIHHMSRCFLRNVCDALDFSESMMNLQLPLLRVTCLTLNNIFRLRMYQIFHPPQTGTTVCHEEEDEEEYTSGDDIEQPRDSSTNATTMTTTTYDVDVEIDNTSVEDKNSIGTSTTTTTSPSSSHCISSMDDSFSARTCINNTGDETYCCCAICYEPLKDGDEITTSNCQKTFHRSCIITWLMQCDTCPYCRNVFKNVRDPPEVTKADTNTPTTSTTTSTAESNDRSNRNSIIDVH